MAFLLPKRLSHGKHLTSSEGAVNDAHSAGPTKSITFSSSSSSSEEDDSDQDSFDGQHSVLSGSTNNTSFSGIVDEYTEGDLQTLNQLVNKLHAAELQREAAKQNQHQHHHQHPDHRNRNEDGVVQPNHASCSSPIDFPSELPINPPPHFSPLQAPHRLSVSAVDSWQGSSIEIVPTENVANIMPQWESEWSHDRLEWEEQRRNILVMGEDEMMMEIKRSRTLNDAGATTGGVILLKRNNSLPDSLRKHHSEGGQTHNLHQSSPPSCSSSSIPLVTKTSVTSATSHSRNYKYGKPPTLPNADNPNPMVSRSSKRINKKHAQYALCAGMMLGIRESVGGATGVEAELQISNWEGWERTWISQEEEDGTRDNEGREVTLDQSVPDDKSVGGPGDKNDTSTTDASTLAQSTGSNLSSSPTARRTNSSNSMSSSSSPVRQNSAATAQQAYTTLTAECERVAKYKLPAHQFYLGSNTSEPLPHKYKFKVYAPLVFARIRSLFGVEKQTFLHSICGKFNFYEFASNARSGQFFFYSHDGLYMIKTLTNTESKFLREILPSYYRHLTCNPSTFLTHFYGMYRVCMPNASNQQLHFVIMRSVFHTTKKIDRVWDLKGSKAGRRANPGDSVSKDLDILEEGRRLRFADPDARGLFLDQLARDATFLARLGIMDYSLLLGLHICEETTVASGMDGASCEGVHSGVNEDNPSSSVPLDSARNVATENVEPSRSNTPLRRGIMQRASSAGHTKSGNDGFNTLKLDDTHTSTTDTDIKFSSALKPIPETPISISRDVTAAVPRNAITPRSDSGIEGYGAKLEDGTLAKKEIYFCGIIDILQYYNAQKLGETVIKKATGNSGEDISCVDPVTYGKRFVNFISNLIEKD